MRLQVIGGEDGGEWLAGITMGGPGVSGVVTWLGWVNWK